MTEPHHDSDQLDLVWGADAIAKELKIKPRAAFHLLETGALPSKKIGGRWCVDRQVLRSFFRTQVSA